MTRYSSIPVRQVAEPLPLRSLLAGEFQPVPARWLGGARLEEPRLEFALAQDPDSMLFAARWTGPLNYAAELSPGTFAAGLWKADVAEFFLSAESKDSSDSRGPVQSYQEFNLSPAGAWWTSSFSGPRVPDEALRRPARSGVCLEAVARSFSGGREAALRIPLEYLGAQRRRGNVCGIVSGRYFSWVDFEQERPDFHCPEQFLPLERTPRA